MMRCHYIYDRMAGKVLIPGCMAVAVSNRIEDCTCEPSLTESQMESQEIKRLKTIIKELQADNKTLISELHRHVDLLNRFRSKRPGTKKAEVSDNILKIESKYAMHHK
ncbi:hypothetical protein [uncultured Duncaniella sp.]|uniref:hypothetical protein n=1 Tax=uncultured Duncaniella sp. TaxID=2768039 RepID=UPI0025AF26A9|nr:hypothetical protein [uncultured Duncaniella sp.]